MSEASLIMLRVSKAEPRDKTPDVHIAIDQKQPIHDDLDSLAEWDAFADKQAKALEHALREGLPGGVYDRLLGLMLAYKSTHFRVSHTS